MSKPLVEGVLRVRVYDVLRNAVEEGVRCGWNRAHKHTSGPTPEHVEEQIVQAVMNAVCEYFIFDDAPE